VINFRYHVVSLAAVFLALAIGLVVGTSSANGPLTENLNEQVNTLTDLLSSSGRRAINLLTHDQLYSARSAPPPRALLEGGASTALVPSERGANLPAELDGS